MTSTLIPFRLDPAAREARLGEFNARAEILWFGFRGRPAAAPCALASAMVAPAGA